ncbi:MAG: phospholipase D family protein [Deltaproteobacteria bacterium]|nr:phospholipase D family protein [Deltaproteobacteria bacterium]
MANRGSPPAMRAVWGTEHYELVVRRVLAARTSVWIATANVKELMVEPHGRPRARYHSVLAEFDRLARDGVELRLLHAGLPSGPFRAQFDALPRLVAGGLALRQCARVHMKTVVVDGSWAYVGSANWTGAGLGAKADGRRNFELGFVTTQEGTLDAVQAHFDRIWRGGECSDCRLRGSCEAPLDLPPPRASGATTVVAIGRPRGLKPAARRA